MGFFEPLRHSLICLRGLLSLCTSRVRVKLRRVRVAEKSAIKYEGKRAIKTNRIYR